MADAERVVALKVSLHVDGEDVPVGALAWARARRTAAFEYAPSFLARGLQISPLNLRLGPNVRIAPATPFDGLFGVFADSLPDGWGRLLVDRRIRALGGDPGALTPLDRLAITGSRGMGALVYRPERAFRAGEAAFDIDALAGAAAGIQAGAATDAGATADVERLLAANGGSAGARPKILVLRDAETGAFSLDDGAAPADGRQAWLVKFRSISDLSAAGRIEHAVALAARAAGISFPDTTTIVGASGDAHFATRRFDRDGDRRIHIHTLAGLLDADFRLPSIDYEGFLKATRIVTARADDVEEAFRRAVFNVLVANRDDHAKNHAFAMSARGDWRLAPAYDVTPSDGPGGEHSMAVCGEGRRPGRADIMRLAKTASIKVAAAEGIIERVEAAITAFGEHAAAAGLDDRQTAELELRFAAMREQFRSRRL